ncbi:FAD-dependent monooxygenase [Amaricoccus sp.]|uniref:FAD-dependent monooxygenase n=1 Tax=Amaricoccus sp. TaxID=1872485 RepID=UPI001B7B8302|nr:FAD-dependent monooxygenase [Amaricoccus sp.]MBP7242984.1 FAD-dependent monooxygenase [Amaricoccus sp.]
MDARAEILIVGAGPTGLVLGLALARRGIGFRLIDAEPGPGAQSRAMAVHARTLEFYRQFGFADEVVAQGIVSEAIRLRAPDAGGGSREVVRIRFGDIGRGLSRYPFVLSYPQDLHERLLVGRLAAAGGGVEWDTRLTGLVQDADGVEATIARTGGEVEVARFAYVCGCDGAHSAVRDALGTGFGGGVYAQPFYVADVAIAGPGDTDLRVNLGEDILALMFPVRTTGMHRLIGLVPRRLWDKTDLGFADIRAEVEALVGIRVAEVNWFSRYRVHHRVADRFTVGRAFLLGDAGHVHSPVGGQGMNTGIGDAVNLGWKLAHVMSGRADPRLLASYDPERLTFARSLIATTDRLFSVIVAGGVGGELLRRIAIPAVVGVGARFGATRRAAFGRVSQIRIAYRDSPLSVGAVGAVRGGDRLPWVADGAGDNFAPLDSLDWQAHVYGEVHPDLGAEAARLGLPVHRFAWSAATEKAGLRRDAVYVVRPDGHVGLAAADQGAAGLAAYFGEIGARPG